MAVDARYQDFYRRSVEDPDGFWREQAALIDWQQDFGQVCDHTNPPFARWFVGGRTNLCHNAVDRHASRRPGDAALIWVSTEVEQERVYSFAQLHREVQTMAALLLAQGVQQGDRVLIYMPMIPEAAFAMLACARIGAIHSVVFGGFASHALANRIDDAQPRLIISADAGSRGGKVVAYKPLLDEAIRLSSQPPEKVLMVDRGLAAFERVPGRDLDGIHFAMEFLPQQNKVNAGDKLKNQIRADGKHVIVIGGGDTGSDCVGTSNRHGAKSVTQFELMPQPPEVEDRPLTWPYWPIKLRTSSSHEEGCERAFAIATKEFLGEKGKLTGVKTVKVEWVGGKMSEVPGSEQVLKADLVFLAMGFVSPVATILEAFGVNKDARGNAKASTDFSGGYATNVSKVFAAGDMRRGQSLVVWAIREGRQAARAVDEFLMGDSELPR